MNTSGDRHEHQHEGDQHDEGPNYFERSSWQDRYAGEGQMWSGQPNPQLVAEVARLSPGAALDLGCGEGGDVIWLAQQGWDVTGADFSTNALARTTAHAEQAGVNARVRTWQVDARAFEADGRTFDLVTCHFLHPEALSQGTRGSGMASVTARLAEAVAPGGHLLVVGHAPSERFGQHSPAQAAAMFEARDLLESLPDGFDVVVCEQRPRTMTRDGASMHVHDSTLLARRGA